MTVFALFSWPKLSTWLIVMLPETLYFPGVSFPNTGPAVEMIAHICRQFCEFVIRRPYGDITFRRETGGRACFSSGSA
ncbi:hypothetical protein Y032_0125g1282 [Ancylostoma ceylanicum]|uniref:Uncharacterized protein n=1 Tax=Ancylostoma ceylanicum TaxID=53326 RepID=A0A016T8S6_9BILA|nr:hypothetical protein Y032_0125g1282 [Ancylostoma ceylanicum]